MNGRAVLEKLDRECVNHKKKIREHRLALQKNREERAAFEAKLKEFGIAHQIIPKGGDKSHGRQEDT